MLSLASIARASAEALLPPTETPHLYRDSDVLRPQAAHHMCHVYYARSLGPLRYMPQAAPLAYAVITLSKQQLATSRCKQIIIMLNKQQEQG